MPEFLTMSKYLNFLKFKSSEEKLYFLGGLGDK